MKAYMIVPGEVQTLEIGKQDVLVCMEREEFRKVRRQLTLALDRAGGIEDLRDCEELEEAFALLVVEHPSLQNLLDELIDDDDTDDDD